MYLLYVDDSGDSGLTLRSPTPFFILSGLIVNEKNWNHIMQCLVDLRKYIKGKWGFNQRAEYKGTYIVNNKGSFYGKGIPPKERLNIYKEWMRTQSKLNIKILNICMRKEEIRNSNPDFSVYENAWRYLIQRFSNFLENSQSGEYGMVFPDKNNEKLVRNLIRKMRVYNPIPKRYQQTGGDFFEKPTKMIIEDPVTRDSKHSYFVQLCDLNAYALYRWEINSLKDAGVWEELKYVFEIIEPVLLKEACKDNKWGIVYYPKK